MTPAADETCAENIAFLRLLHEVPEPPSRNNPGHLPLRHDDYTLSFDRERQFVGACAFLSCIRADLKTVSAVCLQEVHKTKSLNLLVAVNEREFDAGRAYLQEVEVGFKRVFQELRKVGTADEADVQAKLFQAVIKMCSERILQRLGLSEINGRPGKPIRDTLQKVIHNMRNGQAPSTDAIHQTRVAIRRIDAWWRHQQRFRLGEIVDGLHDFTRSPAWGRFVACPPTQDLQQSQIDKLVREIRKLARFRDVSRYMYRTAKRYPIARALHVVAVRLPQTLFERTPLEDYAAPLEQVYKRFGMGKFKLAQVSRLLKTHPSDAKTTFAASVRSIRKDSGIHAEVQLLVYCDRYLHGLKPRVICSNKQACFLCNLAINTHGKLYTPYTHGRLYRAWRWPRILGDQLAGQLNIDLRERAQASLRQMKRESKAIGFKWPDESASHTLVISSIALGETEPSQGAREGEFINGRGHSDAGTNSPSPHQATATENGNSDDTDGAVGTQSPRASPSSGSQEEKITPARITTSLEEVEEGQGPDTVRTPSEPGNVNATSTGGNCSGHILRRGETVSASLTPCRDNSKLFIADGFDLVVDRATPSDLSSGAHESPRPFTCDLSWVTAEEVSHTLEQSGPSTFDVDTLGEVALPLDGPTTFFIRDGDRCVLRISISAEP